VKRVLSRANDQQTNLSALFFAFDPEGVGIVSDRDCCSLFKALNGSFQPRELMELAISLPGAEQGMLS